MFESSLKCSAVVQTVSGEEANNICKEEWQAFMKYFVRPMVERAVKTRLDNENKEAVVPTYTVHRKDPGTEQMVTSEETLQQICDYWTRELNGAFVALAHKQWYGEKLVPMSAYRPTTADGGTPFFVTLDNAAAHSHWLDYNGKRIGHEPFPGVPQLQRPTIPSQEHDAHQVVEHAIGFIKSWVRKQLARARAARSVC
jgi:hypothetical protein